MAVNMNFKMPELTKEQQQLAVAVALFVGAFGFIYFKYFWTPITKRISAAGEKIEDVDKQIATAQAQAKRLPMLEKELVQLQQQEREIERRLPKTKEIPDLIDTLSDMGRRFHVDVLSIAPQGKAEKQYFTELAYGLTLKGNYHSVAQFLTALGISERIFNTRNVVLSPASGQPGTTLQATFQLLVYQYKG